MKFIAIIPSRYGSTRFPGKPLADIGGKPMIQHVYEHTAKCIDEVVVATDDDRIVAAVKNFGGKVEMTSDLHRSGTDRCLEAYENYCRKTGKFFDVVVNIQGDEPFIRTEQINAIKTCFADKQTQIATLVRKIDDSTVITDPNKPKVVIDLTSFAIYFSRSAIPYIRDVIQENWLQSHSFYQHIGMYAYKVPVLKQITRLETGLLEKAESLEQLRWLENGYKIKVAFTEFESLGIDTPQDLQKAFELGYFK